MSDLAKFHLTNDDSSNDQNPLNSNKKFKLPNLFTKPNETSSPLALPKLNFGNSTKLSLNSNQSSPMSLPKLNFSIPNQTNSVSPLQSSLQKIMELKKLSLSEHNSSPNLKTIPNDKENIISPTTLDDDDWVVDLSSALKTDTHIPTTSQNTLNNNSVVVSSNKSKTTEIENFIPKFIDCDFYQSQVTHECEIDCSKLRIKILNIKKRSATKFGRTLCRRYAIDWKPKIRHEFKPKNHIRCYNFAMPSPDDLVAMAIAKAKIRN